MTSKKQGPGKWLFPLSRVMSEKILPHQRPNRSRLEQWLNEITRMREFNWPYARIAQWLADEQQVSITREAVRQFCVRRGIPKGGATPEAAQQGKSLPQKTIGSAKQSASSAKDGIPKAKPTPIFQYDDSRPIDRWAEKECSEGGGQ